jgi:hypothetical protein
MSLMQKRRTLGVLALFVAFLAVLLFYFMFPRWRAASAIRSSIASMSHARSLTIQGQFIDRDERAKKQIVAIVTNATDIAAVATLFQSAKPKLDLGTSYAFARGDKVATPLHGRVSIALDKTTNEVVFLSTDLLLGEGRTVVRLDGFSCEEIYATLKKRNLL